MPDREDMQGAPQATTGLGLGERLRSARKARALSVQQVAETLRLEEASVIALEDGRFDAMGAPVFVRGHLRRYAQLVGLSPETVLDAYRAASPGSEAPPSLARPREQADTMRVPSWIYWIAAVLAIIGLAIAMSGGNEDAPTNPPSEESAPAPGPTVDVIPPMDQPAAAPTGTPQVAPPAEAAPPPAAQAPPAPGAVE